MVLETQDAKASGNKLGQIKDGFAIARLVVYRLNW